MESNASGTGGWGDTLRRVSVHVQAEIDDFLDSLMHPVAPVDPPAHSFFQQTDDASLLPPPPPPLPSRNSALSEHQPNWMNDNFWEDMDMEMQNMPPSREVPPPLPDRPVSVYEKDVQERGEENDIEHDLYPSAPPFEDVEDSGENGGGGLDNSALDALFNEILLPPQPPQHYSTTAPFDPMFAMQNAFEGASAPPFSEAPSRQAPDELPFTQSMNMTLRAIRASEAAGRPEDERKPVPRGRGKGAPIMAYDKHDKRKFYSMRKKKPRKRPLAAGTRQRDDVRSAADVPADANVGKARKRKGGAHIPFWTLFVAAADIGMMVFVLIKNGGFESFGTNPWGGPAKHVLLDYGAKYTPYIRDCPGQCYHSVYYEKCGGDWWRLVSAMFLHIGIGQLLLNLLIMFRIGWSLERQYGTLRVAPIFLLSGIAGTLASGIMLPYTVSVTSSGALFGYVGVLLADLVHNWSIIASPVRNLLFIVFGVVIALALGFLPGVDNFTNVVGLLEGIIAGLIFLPSIAGRTRKCHQGLRWTLIAIMVPVNVVFFGMLVMVFLVCVKCDDCKVVTCIPVLDFCSE